MRRLRDLILSVAMGGCSSSSAPLATTPPTVADQGPKSSGIDRTWIVDKHIMVRGSGLSEGDANGFHGRTIELDAKGYMSPWHGSCAEATRTLAHRPFVDVVDELEVEDADRPALKTFGFDDDVAELRLTCNDRANPPPFLVFVSNGKAMTCFRGACYLMIQF